MRILTSIVQVTAWKKCVSSATALSFYAIGTLWESQVQAKSATYFQSHWMNVYLTNCYYATLQHWSTFFRKSLTRLPSYLFVFTRIIDVFNSLHNIVVHYSVAEITFWCSQFITNLRHQPSSATSEFSCLLPCLIRMKLNFLLVSADDQKKPPH